MAARLTRWKLGEDMGRPRVAWFQSWVDSGVLNRPGPDGRWDESEASRLRHARELAKEVRPLPPRALLMHRDGYPVSLDARRRAVTYVLGHMGRRGHKMSHVLWELEATRPDYRPPRASARVLREPEVGLAAWTRAAEVAPDAAFDRAFSSAFYLEAVLKAAARRHRLPLAEEMPYVEHLSLGVVLELLHEHEVRDRLGIPAEPARYTITGVPDEERRKQAPLLNRPQSPRDRNA